MPVGGSGLDRSWYREMHGFPTRRRSKASVLWHSSSQASSKSDYGLEDLQNLNVKDRFSVFERTSDDEQEKNPAAVEVKRSDKILKKIKKFQMAEGGGGAGVELGDASSEEDSAEDSEDEDVPRDPDVVRSTKKTTKERPMSFSGMGDVKNRFEEGHERRERMREERKGELTKLRGMICGARDRRLAYEETLSQEAQAELKRTVKDPREEIQVNLKAYEQAVQEADSQRPAPRAADAVSREKAVNMASRFERGELSQAEEDAETRRRREEDAALFREAGTARGARSLFKELDASGYKEGVVMRSPSSTGKTEFRRSVYESEPASEIVKSSSKHDDIHVETSAVSSRFKFFETYKEPEKQRRQFRFSPPREGTVKGDSPDREIERDPNVVRADDPAGSDLVRSDTARRMLNKFKQMEQGGGADSQEASAGREKPQGNARHLLSMFRQMEEDAQRQDLPDGPKPLKSFTPPPEYTEETDSDEYTYTDDSEYTDSEDDSGRGVVRSSHKLQDEILTQRTDQARNLKAKFERWEQKMEKENKFDADDECKPSLETARNLRSMFEAMKHQPTNPEKPKPKVNRFVGLPRRGPRPPGNGRPDPEPESDPDRRAPPSASASFWGDDAGDDTPTSFWERRDEEPASFWDRQEERAAGSRWDRREDSWGGGDSGETGRRREEDCDLSSAGRPSAAEADDSEAVESDEASDEEASSEEGSAEDGDSEEGSDSEEAGSGSDPQPRRRSDD